MDIRFKMYDLLPDLVMINIFKFLPVEDLVLHIPDISPKWAKLSSCPALWRDVVFEAPDGMSDTHIMRIFQKAPQLRHFRLNHADDIDAILEQLTTHCDHIQTIRIKWKKGPNLTWISKLLYKYPNLEQLESLVPPYRVTLDYMRYLGGLDDGKCFIVRDVDSQLYLSTHGDEFFQRTTCLLNDTDVDKFFSENRGLRHVAVSISITPRILDHLYSCNNLQSLYINHTNDIAELGEFEFDIAKLSSISTLENLHLDLSTIFGIAVVCNPVNQVQFQRLVKLEILSTNSSHRLEELLSACNNLQILNISVLYLFEEELIGLEECRKLKHLDLCGNVPYLGNETISRIAQGCHELEFLDLSYWDSGEQLNLEILRPCSKIGYLRLNGCSITDPQLREMPSIFMNLLELHIKNCRDVTEDGVATLKRLMPNLRVIRN